MSRKIKNQIRIECFILHLLTAEIESNPNSVDFEILPEHLRKIVIKIIEKYIDNLSKQIQIDEEQIKKSPEDD